MKKKRVTSFFFSLLRISMFYIKERDLLVISRAFTFVQTFFFFFVLFLLIINIFENLMKSLKITNKLHILFPNRILLVDYCYVTQ